VTAVFAQLDPRTHILEVVNAGHTRAFVRCRDNYVKVGSSGVPLGLLPGRTYERESVPMAEDSQLLLYTDGLTEVFQGDEEFGEERLLELLPEIPDADLLDQVWTTLAQFAGNARQTDDMTALYLFRGAREEVA
jgi:serine phosphatase RsbU (regulator of sigma subunit)